VILRYRISGIPVGQTPGTPVIETKELGATGWGGKRRFEFLPGNPTLAGKYK